MKLFTVVGERPQFIKAAVGSRVFRKSHKEILVHTGQHYDANMSDVFFEELDIPRPDYNLGISGGSHGKMTGQMLEALDRAGIGRGKNRYRLRRTAARGVFREKAVRDGFGLCGLAGDDDRKSQSAGKTEQRRYSAKTHGCAADRSVRYAVW